MSDDWAAWEWWEQKLAGADMQQSEGTPHPGYYRWIKKDVYGGDKYAEPVAYWPGENGELNCVHNGRRLTPERGRDIWVNVCHHPVHQDWYVEVIEDKKPKLLWRDGLPLKSASIGDNKPPPEEMSFDVLRDEIENLAREAKQRLEGPPVADDAEASTIGILANKLSALWKVADERRKAERRVLDDQLKAIQIHWAPVLLAADVYKNLKYKLLTPYELKQKAEHEALLAEAAVTGVDVPESKKKRPTITTRGRAMSLRATKFAEIEDYKACLAFFAEHKDVKDLIQHLANKHVRAGVEVPGVKVTEVSQVV